MNENSLILSKDELNTKRKITHTPSVIQADTLFTFMTELRYLLVDFGKSNDLSPI